MLYNGRGERTSAGGCRRLILLVMPACDSFDWRVELMLRISFLYVCEFAIALTLVVAVDRAGADQGQVGPDPKTLSVLYAGRSDGEQSKRVKVFLEKHFFQVGMCELSKVGQSSTKDYDVIVVDWETRPGRLVKTLTRFPDSEDFNFDALGKFDPLYDTELYDFPVEAIPKLLRRPVVCIGVAGIAATVALEQMDWQISQMGDYAHDVNLSHPIFQGPLPVELNLETIEKPINYFLHPGTEKIGETLQAWKVQDRSDTEPMRGFCCDASYFKNTPSSEAISCGTADAPDSVTIGRYGNYFLWGFASEPGNMTPSAQAAFVNSVCYMAAFKDHLPGWAPHQRDARRAFLDALYSMRSASNEYTAANQKFMEKYKVSALGEGVPADEYMKVDNPGLESKLEQKNQQEIITRMIKALPRAVREELFGDPELIIQYYRENYEYLRLDPRRRYIVDEEAKSLGIPNHSPALLKKCIDLLSSGEDTELALLLLKRYIGDAERTPQEWQKWYHERGRYWKFDESKSKFN
jgi:hypothetical protein